ncbi:MAG: PQQ-binding-like beta-propeller repeat protein, partial [Planctomycetota bacterium]
FDGARAARDLMRDGLIATATDEQMLELARHHLELGHGKIALVIAHSLSDRRSERSVEFVRALAAILKGAEEPRLAAAVLLEAAQLQSDGQQSLQLAEEARALDPRDLGTLSFLRTTMMAHLRNDAPELRQITLDLLDGLIADGDVDRLFSVVEETKQLGHYSPAVMVRESRGHAKKRDRESAIEVMLKAAAGYEELGDKRQQLELLEVAARLDRNRKDIQKQIQQLRSTPQKRAIRLVASIAAGILVLSSAVVWLTGHLARSRIEKAHAQIASLLEQGKLDEATKEFAVLDEELGENPDLDGVRHLVLTAQAEAAQNAHNAARREAASQLQKAGQLVAEGDLVRAFQIYSALRTDPDVRNDIDSASTTRVEELERSLSEAVVRLPDLLPPPPSDLMDRQRIEDNLTLLQRAAPPSLRTAASAIVAASERGTLPESVPEARRKSLTEAAGRAKALLDRGAELLAAYEAAANRSSEQRRLDPLFKQALEAERSLDFELALSNYRKLSAANANTEELARHFQQKVQQLDGILGVCNGIRSATTSGDFKTAHREYQALKRKFPEIPFHKIVQLPVTIRTSMPGAKLRWNGKDLGATPQIATYAPGSTNEYSLSMPRFQPVQSTLPHHEGTVDLLLWLQSEATVELRAAIDQPMAMTSERTFAVDRAGSVYAFDNRTGAELWRVATDDTTGYLSPPQVISGAVVTTSLDCPLRALDQGTGKVRWERKDLATELTPVALDGRLAVCRGDDLVILLDPKDGSELSRRQLPAPVRAEMTANSTLLVAPLADGRICALDVKTLELAWTTKATTFGSVVAMSPSGVVCVDDDGVLTLLDLATGSSRWELDLRGSPTGRPAIDAERVVVTLDERIAVVRLADGTEQHSIPSGAMSWSSAARLLGDYVAAPTRTGELLMFARDGVTPLYAMPCDRDHTMIGDRRKTVLVTSGKRLYVYVQMP